jgi:carboxymethylenebutenolidase
VPVLGFYGGSDARVTSTVEPTFAAAKQLGKTFEPHIFDGAGHGFLRNQSTEPNYKAAEQAWPLTVTFFRDKLK